MSYLTETIADGLCTTIALGYISGDGGQTQFQYSDDSEKADYENVKKAFGLLGVQFNISKSVVQEQMAYIIAKNTRVSNLAYAQLITQDFHKYLSDITNSANAATEPPSGAYIGGRSTISSLFIIGPSALDQYKPIFRAAADETVGSSYNKAVTATNAALSCLKTKVAPKGISLNYADLQTPITAGFESGNLFKSYHGMIQAIIAYKSSVDNNSFTFEIALGENTSKVSSCFPCCTFMTANRTPPTSTHLGRGDNWNIPPKCSGELNSTWKNNITNYYIKGKEILTGKGQLNTIYSSLVANGAEANIPAVFLEALTFEGKFTKKINGSLSGLR